MTEMGLNLQNKVAIITGASRGIGKSIAQTLSSFGVKLTLAARSNLDELSSSLPTESLPLSIDLRKPDSASRVVQATLNKFGTIDILVNNAGATKRGDFLQLTDEEWADGYSLKFFGTMRLIREAWPHLMQSKGNIINIIGIGGRTGSSEFTIGGSVNAALMHLTKSLADRGVQDGVRVNAINPASIETERLKNRIRNFAKENNISNKDEAAKRMAKKFGIARFGTPQEIANAVAFLASPRSVYIHGAILDVDGGTNRAI